MHTVKLFGHPPAFVSVPIGPLLTNANSEAPRPPCRPCASVYVVWKSRRGKMPPGLILLEISRLE